jgi:hypothetical protein
MITDPSAILVICASLREWACFSLLKRHIFMPARYGLAARCASRGLKDELQQQEFFVPPLSLPDPNHLPDLAVLSQYEAVALFIRRAQRVTPDFQLTAATAPAVAEICVRLAKSVTDWYADPQQPERQFGWVTEAADAYVRPVKRIAVRCRKPDGMFAYGVLISALSAQQALTQTGQSLCLLEDPAAVLLAYVTFYDQRGGGVETSFKGDKQGLGLGKRSKKRFEAQQMLMLLGSLAHNVIVWARHWLTSPTLHHYGAVRMVRDVFHISGFLLIDACGQVVQIVLNQAAPLASALVDPLRKLLLCAQVAVNLGQT